MDRSLVEKVDSAGHSGEHSTVLIDRGRKTFGVSLHLFHEEIPV